MTGSVSRSPEVADALKPFAEWDGTTYYGRQQLKPWPMEPPVVGAYILLAGLSGASQILATVAAATGRRDLDGAVRRGRYLSLLAPTLGSALLIYDLHTPKRFYNMLRVAKATSPMSIGTWFLMGFSACAGVAAAGQAGSDRWPKRAWMRGVAGAAGVPGAVLGGDPSHCVCLAERAGVLRIKWHKTDAIALAIVEDAGVMAGGQVVHVLDRRDFDDGAGSLDLFDTDLR